jgi:hypothetical protein
LTLIVIVPTSAGLVIAADSRITIGSNIGLYCDNVFKVTEIENIDRAAFVVTGNSTVWDFKVPDRGSVNPTPLGGLGQRHFAA